MRISLNWLRELVDINLTPEELAKTLTIAGFEVEDIQDLRSYADGVVIGKILDCQRHPNADKLSVTKVDIGKDTPLNIVCGAPNVRSDIFVAVATVDTYLPAINLKLRPVKLRGVPSEGMICSLSELGLEKDSEGIHIFGDNLTLGLDVRPLLGLDDVILDVTSTANRADALSMIGLAREIAALTGATLHLPDPKPLKIPSKNGALNVEISDSQACYAYFATLIDAVTIAPSPDWLKNRLKASGVRPINNVVDVTNYILLEWGQPLHAFDRDRLQALTGEKLNIGVRFAQPEETLQTLDGQNRPLKEQNLLITCNERAVALAGVMGGEETEVYQGTQNLLLEAALFGPVAIRRSSRSQSLRSEASTRYERGVNQAEFELANARAIALITELAGGNAVTQATSDYRSNQVSGRTIELRLKRLQEILGPVKVGESIGQITTADVERTLTALGCKLESVKPDVWTVTVPPYRYRDLEREIDLIEEVARLYGYDNFCEKLPDKTEPGYLSVAEQLRRKMREGFRGLGLTEVVQYSLVKPTGEEVVLENPLFAEYSSLRTNLIPGLIDAFEYNLSQNNGYLNAFEIGRIFWQQGQTIQEADAIGGIMGGDRAPLGRWTRSGKESPLTWYEAKGILENIFELLGFAVEYRGESTDVGLHPGRTASLWLNHKPLGIFGQLHPQLRAERGLPEAVYVFQLSFPLLLEAIEQQGDAIHFSPYSTYPPVQRDLAFFAPVKVSVAQLETIMKTAAKDLLEGVELFDQYQGQNVPQGQRSLAFSLVYRASDRTLTDEEIEPVHQKVREALTKQFEVTLRS